MLSTGCRQEMRSHPSSQFNEVQDGFLDGLYKPCDLPNGCIVSPRFGLQQKNKLRPIDNFSASQVNGATVLLSVFVLFLVPFASLHALALTDWCLAHKQQSCEQKKLAECAGRSFSGREHL